MGWDRVRRLGEGVWEEGAGIRILGERARVWGLGRGLRERGEAR